MTLSVPKSRPDPSSVYSEGCSGIIASRDVGLDTMSRFHTIRGLCMLPMCTPRALARARPHQCGPGSTRARTLAAYSGVSRLSSQEWMSDDPADHAWLDPLFIDAACLSATQTKPLGLRPGLR